MKLVLVALGLLLGAQVSAQTQNLYKCKNAAGRITYAERECKELGLIPLGEVKNEVNVAPGMAHESDARRRTSRPPSTDAGPVTAPEAPPEPPARRCFTVKTAKGGTVTRCNDRPEEPEQPEGAQQ